MSTITWTELPDQTGQTLSTHSGSWPEFITRLATIGTFPDKASCPWVKMATFGDKRTNQNSLRSNDNLIEIYGIEGDYDGKALQMDTAQMFLEAYG